MKSDSHECESQKTPQREIDTALARIKGLQQ
jgi:phage-related protein